MKPHVEWFSVERAAEYLDFPSARAFRVWNARQRAARRPHAPVYRVGTRIRYRRVDLDALPERERPRASDDASEPALHVVGGRDRGPVAR